MMSFARKEVEKNVLKEFNANYPLFNYYHNSKGCLCRRFGYFYFKNNYFPEFEDK